MNAHSGAVRRLPDDLYIGTCDEHDSQWQGVVRPTPEAAARDLDRHAAHPAHKSEAQRIAARDGLTFGKKKARP
jgi:hypothetical protein